MKFGKPLVILTSLLFLVACKNEPERAMPSVLLPENQMVDVMVDVQIMESIINVRKNTNKKTLYLRTRGFDTIFSHHGINDSIFIENFNYYSDNPATMLRILDSVTARLTKMKEIEKEDK